MPFFVLEKYANSELKTSESSVVVKFLKLSSAFCLFLCNAMILKLCHKLTCTNCYTSGVACYFMTWGIENISHPAKNPQS